MFDSGRVLFRRWPLVPLSAAAILVPCDVPADVKPGDFITKANMQDAAELLPPSVVNMLEYGMCIEVRETESCPWPEVFKRATEKYASQVRLSDDKLELHDYIAGTPFPTVDANDPDVAWKIVLNHEHKPAFSDDLRTEWVVEIQNDTGATEKLLASEVWRSLKWEGRITIDPTPVLRHELAMRYT